MEDFAKLDALTMKSDVRKPNMEVKKTTQDNPERMSKVEKMKRVFEEMIKKDPSLLKKFNSWSHAVEVVNTLGFGDSGSVVTKEPPPGEKIPKSERELVSTSKIVGYRIKNISKNIEIPYVTEEYTKSGEGLYVGKIVKKILQPGETVELTRKYMTILCTRPEISMRLANGRMKGKLGDKEVNIEKLHDMLATYYFVFSDPSKKVNSDEVKINIGQKVQVGDKLKWVVKPEFILTFGYLNNQALKKKRKSKKQSGPDALQIASVYITKLLEDAGINR